MEDGKLYELAYGRDVPEARKNLSVSRQAFQEYLNEQANEVKYRGYVLLLQCEKYLRLNKLTDALGIKWHNPDIEIAMVKNDPRRLRYVEAQTPELCLVAVQYYANRPERSAGEQILYDWFNLAAKLSPIGRASAVRFIKDLTPELSIAAVKDNGHALGFIKHRQELTQDLIMEAVKQSGFALQYVDEQTPGICLAAVNQNGFSLQFVRDQTPEICLAAVQNYPLALEFVEKQTPEICLAAVRRSPEALKFVDNQTPELCAVAAQANPSAMRYVRKQTPEVCMAAVKANPDALEYIRRPTPAIQTAANKGAQEMSLNTGPTHNARNLIDPSDVSFIGSPEKSPKVGTHDIASSGSKNLDDLIGKAKTLRDASGKVSGSFIREEECSL